MDRDPRAILMVEDNPADVESVRRALDQIDVPTELTVIDNGVEAYDRLNDGRLFEPVAPDLILLDLNVPGLDGREFLRVFDEAPPTRIPLVVLTTSHNRDDVAYAYRHGANAYVMKPSDAVRFLDVVQSVCTYWFETVDPDRLGEDSS